MGRDGWGHRVVWGTGILGVLLTFWSFILIAADVVTKSRKMHKNFDSGCVTASDVDARLMLKLIMLSGWIEGPGMEHWYYAMERWGDEAIVGWSYALCCRSLFFN